MLCIICSRIKELQTQAWIKCTYPEVEYIRFSGEKGCAVCFRIERTVGGELLALEAELDTIFWTDSSKDSERKKRLSHHMQWELMPKLDGSRERSIKGHLLVRNQRAPEWNPVLLKVLESFDASLVFNGRWVGTGIYRNPKSPACIALAKSWLTESEKTERDVPMASHSDSSMPSRLLDIFNSPGDIRVRLRNCPQSGTQDYAALSYCWGKGNNLRTLRSNLKAHRKGILLKTLPPCIQDAIFMARGLGFRLLWVDALCIVQDDAADWAHESRLMGSIYHKASLTIAVSSQSDCSRHWLVPRNTGVRPLKLWNLDDARGPKGLYLIPQVLSWGNDFDSAPLALRGWTYQERLLSTRVLHIGKTQMAFEDVNGLKTEAWSLTIRDKTDPTDIQPSLVGMPSNLGWLPTRSSRLSLEVISIATFYEDIRDLETLFLLWNKTIDEYTKRKLSYQQDKMAALLGIANRFATSMGTELKIEDMAQTLPGGIWRNDFVRGLCWYVRYGTTAVKNSYAPSWSWLCMESHLGFATSKWGENVYPIESITFEVSLDTHSFLFGGSVHIRTKPHHIGSSLEDIESWTSERNLRMKYDFATSRLTSAPFLAILLLFEDKPIEVGGSFYYMIIQSFEENCYQRIGLASGEQPRSKFDLVRAGVPSSWLKIV